MDMPIPETRIHTLANRLAAYSFAVNALARAQEIYPPGDELPDDVKQMHNQLAMIKEQYLAFREQFENLRADYEHQFMTWHTGVTDNADRRFTGGAVPAGATGDSPRAKPWGGAVPEWVENESHLAKLADHEATKALEEALNIG